MRRIAITALGVLAILATPALAQDSESVSFEARVVDYSSMLAGGGEGGGHGGLGIEMPIVGAHVRFIVRGGGAAPQSIESQTDDQGHVKVDLPNAGPDTVVEFLVSPGDGGSEEPGYYARPWEVGSGPAPDVVKCYRVTTDPSALWMGMLSQSLSKLDDGSAELRMMASVINVDSEFRVFFAVNDPTTGRGAIPIPIPRDFGLQTATIDGAPAQAKTIDAPHGGRAFPLTGTVFPSTRGDMRGTQVFLTATAPWESGRRYDFSFHPDVPVGRYVLSVQEAAFHVTQPDGSKVKIYDAGPQESKAPGGGITRAFVVESIAAHSDVKITLNGGTPFPVRAAITTAIIALMVLAGAFLGLALRRGGSEEKQAERLAKRLGRASHAGAQPGELERLEARLRRGEITSVEYDIRKRALTATGVAATVERAPKAHKAAVDHVSGAATPHETVGLIEGRVGVATKEQLREDVHTLARLLREQLDA